MDNESSRNKGKNMNNINAKSLASKRGRASRRRGKRGEREALCWLRNHGIECQRTSEFLGDILLTRPPARPSLSKGSILIEVKYRNRITLGLLRQVLREKPFVIWRETHRGWKVSMWDWQLAELTGNQDQHGSYMGPEIVVTVDAEDFAKLWRPQTLAKEEKCQIRTERGS